MLTEAGEQCTVGIVGTVGRAFVTFSLLPDLVREGERVSWQRQGQGQRPKRPPCVAVFSPNLDLTNSYQALRQCVLWLKVYKYVCDLVDNVLLGNVAIVKDEKCVEGMFKNARIQSLMGTQQELIVASH